MRKPDGDSALVLQSVGTANASALRAIRQVAPHPIQEVARLVYQAPSLLASGLRADVAEELANLLGGLGFRVGVTPKGAGFEPGKGELEVALVVTDVARLAAVVAEAAAFLGTDAATARRMLCRSPAVLLTGVSEATVVALRERFVPLGAAVDVSRSDTATYHALLVPESKAIRRGLVDLVRSLAPEATIEGGDVEIAVAGLTLERAKALWEQARRLGVRASICNRELERYDVSLNEASVDDRVRSTLVDLGIPARVVPRLLSSLPVVIRQNATHCEMLGLLARLTEVGGRASAIAHSLQRFGLVLEEVHDRDAAVKVLAAIGEVSETASRVATRDAPGARLGPFSRTTALWLQHALAAQRTEASIELI